MRVDDRTITITNPPGLNPNRRNWRGGLPEMRLTVRHPGRRRPAQLRSAAKRLCPGRPGQADAMNQISPALVEDAEQQSDRGLWPGEPPSFGARNLDDLLIWAYREGASDNRLQTNTPVFIQIHGRMRQVTSRGPTQAEIEEAVRRTSAGVADRLCR